MYPVGAFGLVTVTEYHPVRRGRFKSNLILSVAGFEPAMTWRIFTVIAARSSIRPVAGFFTFSYTLMEQQILTAVQIYITQRY